MRRLSVSCFGLVVALGLGCDRTVASQAGAAASQSSAPPDEPAPTSSSRAPVAEAVPDQVEIRACAPLEEGELRLFDVDAHTAARLVAIARRTPVVAAGTPHRGCAGRCRDMVLKGPAESDLTAIGFEVTRADELLLAGPTKLAGRRLLAGGPTIDIDRERASVSEVVAILAGNNRIEQAAAAALTGEVTVVARNVSGHRLLDAIAALGGGRLRVSANRVAFDAVRGLASVGALALADCAAPVCPVVVARCSDVKQLHLVAVMRRATGRALPQPLALGAGIQASDTSAFVADETGMTWRLSVGDHVGKGDSATAHDGEPVGARRVDAISCGTVTLDDGTTITRAR